MTATDDIRPAPPTTEPKGRPRFVWYFGALALVLLLVGLAGGSFQSKLSDVQKNDNSAFSPSSADSTKVSNAAGAFQSVQTIPGNMVFERDGGLTAADKQFISKRDTAFRKIKNVAADQVGQPTFSTTDPGVAQIYVPLVGTQGGVDRTGPQLVDAEKAVIKAAKVGAPSGLVVHSAGSGGVLVAFIDAFSGLDGTLLISAGLVVIVILLFVYRSPVLWFFPLFSAVLALGAASLVIYPLAKHNVITLNGQSQGILSVLVIGAGTDYALLLVSRYREELHEYDSRVHAMIAAWKGAAPAIGASAVTVILGLLCLTFAELNSTAGLGPVCAIGIACTVIVMLTVLPALLVVAGRWIFWPKRPAVDHKVDIGTTHPTWSRFARGITGHRRRSWVGAAILLIICTAFITTLRTQGLSTEKGFTNKPEAVVGQDIYDKAFPTAKGSGAPANILTDQGSVNAVIAATKKVQGVVPASVCVETDFSKIASASPAELAQFKKTGCAPKALQVTPHDGRLLVDATLTDSYDSTAAYDTVDRLRSTLGGVQGADALVGGSSATNLDIQNASRHDRDVIIPLVLLVILIVLGVVLRALIAPILLIITVVLSFTASLGVSALFFNHVFHFANADPAFPLFAFVFLVALGIDYNIFLMTRVREETLEHGTRDGIVRGLAVTGGVITSAGLVLAATFVVLGVLPIVFLAEVGFTVAFGVLLDTVVVRSILVPSLSHDIGKKIWWPSKLAAAGAPD
ncbi:MMPL family transporter [Jatrophihabitans endophyticus]|uniref:MMPL family transporter n=1 Tax=Jatrophihabitans endophyticus TaxID=1206085 RepID=UPI0019EA8BAC|nr:MMPL family transporter [Jatrophihabitans endophyticus]MBE7186816.1 MMPL family transporter [Jatrophihabitans endophyticus]